MQREDTVFCALADPSRRAILERLTRGGLMSERRDGRLVYYRVEPNGLRPLIDRIAHYQAFWFERLDRLQALLKGMDE